MREREQVPYILVERDSGGVGAFLLGAILGAGVALLFAPRSGEETQREIKERVTRLRDAAEQRVQQMGERLDEARDEVKDRVDAIRDAVESGREAASEARTELEGRIERTKAAYRAGVEAARGSAGAEGEEPEED